MGNVGAMIRIFVAPSQIDLSSMTAHITGQDHQHLARVLRARAGQPVTVLDGLGSGYSAVLTAIDKHSSTARIEERIDPPAEPAISITIAQALGKSDKFEQVIQHGSEAGASAFVPIQAERSSVEIPAERMADRAARWQAIAKGAAEQSFRARVPLIGPLSRLADVLRAAEQGMQPALLLHPAPDAVSLYAALRSIKTPPGEILLLVGPEGGWTAKKVELARAHASQPITLGPHILRTETAALVAISQLLYHFARPQECTSCVS